MAPVKKPAKADAPTAEGAEAFARYWVEVVNHAYATFDTAELQRLGTDECETCRNYVKSLRESAADGEVYEGGRYRC